MATAIATLVLAALLQVEEPQVWRDEVDLGPTAPPAVGAPAAPAVDLAPRNSFTGEISAYCLRGTTASGVQTQPGVVAAGPQIPLGTHLWIEGIGSAIVLDRGGAIVGNRVDVWMSSCAAADRWGRQYRQVVVLE